MPVSSPSYFPPNRSNGTIVGITAGNNTTGARNFLAGLNAGKGTTSNDLIVIGDSAFAAGDTQSNGSIVIGSSAGAALKPAASTNGLTIIGYKAINTAITADDLICIGANCLAGLTEDAAHAIKTSVIMGGNILAGYTGANDINIASSVMIGSNIIKNATFQTSTTQCVLIGNSVCSNNGANNQIDQSVIIGSLAGPQGTLQDVIIGTGALQTGSGGTSLNVVIGANANSSFDLSLADAVLIGANAKASGNPTGSGAIAIGFACQAGFNSISIGNTASSNTSRSVIIGLQAGSGVTLTNDSFFVGTYDNVNHRSIFFGNFNTGNLLIGNAGNTAANQEFGGAGATNVLKLLNGTKGGSSPVGGGYFYLTGANNDVHWVGSDGVDTNLVLGASGGLTYTYNAPLTGFSITIANDIEQLVLEPAGTLATGTVTLPAAPEDGDTVGISTTQTITALTISPNTGQTVADAPTTLGVGGAVRFLYRATNTTWYRIAN